MPTDSNSDIRRFLSVARRRLPIILAVTVLLPAAVFVVLHQVTKKYTAGASLIFQANTTQEQIAGVQAVSQTPDPESNVQLVTLGDTASLTAKRVGGGLTAKKVRQMLSIQAVGDTNVVTVSATSPSAALAARVANAYSEIFVNTQSSANHAYYSHALSVVTRQLAQIPKNQDNTANALALQEKAQSLGLLSQLSSSGVQLAQRSNVPLKPSSPKIVEDTVIAVVLGFLLGVGIAFAVDGLDRKVREPSELADLYNLPMLGAIPASSGFGKPPQGEERFRAQAGVAEAFQLVNAHLRYFNVDREIRVVLVTSAHPGDGKTTISTYLAAAAARMGSAVLLIEADLRRPTVARGLGLEAGPGLTDVLIDPDQLIQVIQTIPLGTGSPHSNGDSPDEEPVIDVIVAGRSTPPNPVGMLESHAMEDLVAYGRENYDLVLIDTPPVTAVSDVFSLLKYVDGVIVVGRIGKSDRKVTRRASETLHTAGAELLGVVANEVRGEANAYYYGAYTS